MLNSFMKNLILSFKTPLLSFWVALILSLPHPASAIEIPKEPRQALEVFLTYLDSRDFNADTAIAFFNQVYDTLFELPENHFKLDKINWEQAKVLRQLLWRTHRKLFEKIKGFSEEEKLNRPLADAFRKVLLATRVCQDFLLQLMVHLDGLNPPKKRPQIFFGQPWFTVYEPDKFPQRRTHVFDYQWIRPGSVFLTMTQSPISSMITRLGSLDGHFSHAALYHVDEHGQGWVIEAVLEKGVDVRRIEDFLNDNKTRILILEHKDMAFAKERVRLTYERAMAAIQAGKPIPYNFRLNLGDGDSEHCVSLARSTFQTDLTIPFETTGAVPRFPTYFQPGSRDILNRLGVAPQQECTIAPSDFLVAPEFEPVAEWTNPFALDTVRMHDTMLAAIYDWMEKEDYHFAESPKAFFWYPLHRLAFGFVQFIWKQRVRAADENAFGRSFSQFLVKVFRLENRFPSNMLKSTIELMFYLRVLIRELAKGYHRGAKEFLETHPRAFPILTYKEIRQVLEQARQRDLARWRPGFHHFFGTNPCHASLLAAPPQEEI